MLRPSQSDSWKSSLAWVICVKIALICCKAYLAASRPQAASLLTAFPRRSFWCFLNLKGCSFSFFFAIFQKLDGEMLKGFLRVEEPGSSALLSLSASSWADTSSTLSLFVTSSTPSLAEGLLFRRSWTVPFNLNLFKILFKDRLWLGGGGVDLSPSVSRPPEHWKSSQKKQNVGDYLRAYSAWICAKPALWIFFSTRKALWASVHSRTGMIDSGIIQTCQECAKIVELEKKKNVLWSVWISTCFQYIF